MYTCQLPTVYKELKTSSKTTNRAGRYYEIYIVFH